MADYYTSHNAAGGGAGSTGDPYTLQEAFDNVSAGDTIHIMNTGTYTISTPIDIDTTAGTLTAPISVRGANDSGTDYDGSAQVTITTTTNSLARLFYLSGAIHYYRWFDLKFDGGGSGKASYCFQTDTSNHDNHFFSNCRFTNADSHGAYMYIRGGVDEAWTFVDCEFDSNGQGGSEGSGMESSVSDRCYATLINCSAHDNYGAGTHLGMSSNNDMLPIIGNRFYDNGGAGCDVEGNGTIIFMSNVCYGNTGNGFQVPSGEDLKIHCMVNNIFSGNGGYGVDLNSMDADQFVYADYNCYYDNTSGSIDILSGTPPGDNNVTSDPKFTAVTDGSEDFTLQSDSPCKDVGFGYNG